VEPRNVALRGDVDEVGRRAPLFGVSGCHRRGVVELLVGNFDELGALTLRRSLCG
jgi:hypothetical protein